jgi:site-specific recombinase XerD
VLTAVSQALARAGIDPRRKGAHQFRHALACEMLRQGASLPEIGQISGHRGPKTTTNYAKVDLASSKCLPTLSKFSSRAAWQTASLAFRPYQTEYAAA